MDLRQQCFIVLRQCPQTCSRKMLKSRLRTILFALLLVSLLPTVQTSADEVGNCVEVKLKNVPKATVFFKNDSAVLEEAAKETLDEIIADLQGSNVVKLKITGFVSAVGPKSKHSTLSSERAKNVEAYLAENGIQVEFVTSGEGVTKRKSKSAKARKATITAVVEEKVSTGSYVPQIKITSSGILKFEQNKIVSIDLVAIEEKSLMDKVNPTTFSISPALPEGLVFDSKSGKVTGSTSKDNPAVIYTVTASNACGSKTVKVEIQTIVAPAPTPTQTPSIEFLSPDSTPSAGPSETPKECNNDFGNDNKINCSGGNPDRGRG